MAIDFGFGNGSSPKRIIQPATPFPQLTSRRRAFLCRRCPLCLVSACTLVAGLLADSAIRTPLALVARFPAVSANMTRAQQTISIGLLVSSVRPIDDSAEAVANHESLALPCLFPATHPFQREDSGRDHPSREFHVLFGGLVGTANTNFPASFLGARILRFLSPVQSRMGCLHLQ